MLRAAVLRDDDWFSPPSSTSWGIFGELGAEESGVAISSMSEYVLEPFLRLNALLKELLSYRDKKDSDLKLKEQIANQKHWWAKTKGNYSLKDIKQKPNILQNYKSRSRFSPSSFSSSSWHLGPSCCPYWTYLSDCWGWRCSRTSSGVEFARLAIKRHQCQKRQMKNKERPSCDCPTFHVFWGVQSSMDDSLCFFIPGP